MAFNRTDGVAPINVTMLPAVNPDCKNCIICVRVTRMWRVLNPKRDNDPMSIELVLMDSEGNKIHASIKEYLFYKFEKDVREDSVYYLSDFDVVPNLGEYRSTRHAYKIDFVFGTKIWEAASKSVPAALFVFTPPALCFKPEFESDYLVDIIGVLTEVGAAREFVRNGAKSKLLIIELDNNGYRFECTLFGSLVDELKSFLSSGETVNTVLVILFVKVKIWKGRPKLQTTMHSSKLIFNPDIAEVAALRPRMVELVESSESPVGGLSQLQESKSKSIEDNFPNHTPKATIEEIKNCNEDLMDKLSETTTEAISDVNSNATTAIFGISSDNQETPLSKPHCKVPKLSTNTSLSSSNVNTDMEEMKKFADWILQVDGDITIPDDLLILDDVNPLQSLIDFAYPSLLTNMSNKHFFEERSILASRPESAEHVNDYVMSLIPTEEKEYLSCDTSCQFYEDSNIPGEWIPMEFLNTMKCSDIPDHKLKLKVGVPVMVMKTIDESSGLCNGTRLLVNHLGNHVISATILTGKNIGEQTLIPRIDFVSSDRRLPFKFKRRQFPVALCFAMPIDKSQEQSLSHVAIYFPEPVCNHRQLYVALSQVN